MRNILAVTMFAAVMAVACSRQEVPGTAASDAAKVYYDMLVAGNYDDFVSGMYFTDSIPAGYREQLVANIKMFAARQRDEHQGIAYVNVLSQECDSLSPAANVFLLLTYCDSTKEEIVVPMIESNGRWLMR